MKSAGLIAKSVSTTCHDSYINRLQGSSCNYIKGCKRSFMYPDLAEDGTSIDDSVIAGRTIDEAIEMLYQSPHCIVTVNA